MLPRWDSARVHRCVAIWPTEVELASVGTEGPRRLCTQELQWMMAGMCQTRLRGGRLGQWATCHDLHQP